MWVGKGFVSWYPLTSREPERHTAGVVWELDRGEKKFFLYRSCFTFWTLSAWHPFQVLNSPDLQRHWVRILSVTLWQHKGFWEAALTQIPTFPDCGVCSQHTSVCTPLSWSESHHNHTKLLILFPIFQQTEQVLVRRKVTLGHRVTHLRALIFFGWY